jgi:hypothetical protein
MSSFYVMHMYLHERELRIVWKSFNYSLMSVVEATNMKEREREMENHNDIRNQWLIL